MDWKYGLEVWTGSMDWKYGLEVWTGVKEHYCPQNNTAGGQECTGILLPPRNKTAPHKSNSK